HRSGPPCSFAGSTHFASTPGASHASHASRAAGAAATRSHAPDRSARRQRSRNPGSPGHTRNAERRWALGPSPPDRGHPDPADKPMTQLPLTTPSPPRTAQRPPSPNQGANVSESLGRLGRGALTLLLVPALYAVWRAAGSPALPLGSSRPAAASTETVRLLNPT